MFNRKLLIQESESLAGLRGFVEVFEEIAAGRMQKIREAVLAARQFLDGLSSIFADVKLSSLGAVSRLNKNGKTVAVFLSANSGLFGDIVERTYQNFIEYIHDTKADSVVIGKLGLRMLQERHPEVLFNYFDLSDDRVDLESLKLIMRYLLQFEKIMVFYGRFNSILNQNPSVSSISGDDLPGVNPGEKSKYKFLFEPDVGDILQVFESEILASIFEQTMHESLLAKFASRLQHLDRSLQNVDLKIAQVKYETKRLKRKMDNRKQLSRLAGMELWR